MADDPGRSNLLDNVCSDAAQDDDVPGVAATVRGLSQIRWALVVWAVAIGSTASSAIPPARANLHCVLLRQLAATTT